MKNYQRAAKFLVELTSLRALSVTLNEITKTTSRKVNAIENENCSYKTLMKQFIKHPLVSATPKFNHLLTDNASHA